MENWRPEEEKIIKDVRNLVRLKQEIKQLKIKNNLKTSDTREIQLITAINFISSIDNDEEQVMHPKSDNTEIIINDDAIK